MSFEFYIQPIDYEIAERNGISKRTLEQRIQDAGWYKKRAIHTPPRPKKSYGEWVKIAKENGICSATFRMRVNKYGFDMERAATKPLLDFSENMKRVAEGQRVYPKETINLAASNGISYGTFISRIQDGWSVEDAVKTKREKVKKTGTTGWRSGPNIIVRKGVKV